MFGGLIQQVIGDAEESDEERAARLERIADKHDVEATTLYELEEEVKTVARSIRAQKDDALDEAQARIADDPQTAQFAEILDIVGGDVVLDMAGKMAIQNPRLSAEVVLSLHQALDESGLYDDLGVNGE